MKKPKYTKKLALVVLEQLLYDEIRYVEEGGGADTLVVLKHFYKLLTRKNKR